jgi:hypothetical protein
MPSKSPLPDGESRKRRTREHIIADLSVNFVERFILESGFTAERRHSDYGYDLTLTTFDEQGYVEEGFVNLQIKATDQIGKYEMADKDYLSYPVSLKDIRLWTKDPMPVFLILFDSQKRRGWWVYVQAYFNLHPVKVTNAKSISVRFPRKNLVRTSTIQMMKKRKTSVVTQMEGKVEHHE